MKQINSSKHSLVELRSRLLKQQESKKDINRITDESSKVLMKETLFKLRGDGS